MAMAVYFPPNKALYVDQPAVTAFPFTMACWFIAYSYGNNRPCVWVGDKTNDDYNCHMEARAGGEHLYRVRVSKHTISTPRSSHPFPYTEDIWQHAVGVFDGPNSVLGYLNGVAGDENTDTSGVPAGYNRTALGCRMGLTPYYGGNKDLAEVAIWHRPLESWEADILANRHSPLFLLDGLKHYWPLGGRFGQHYRDIVGGYDLSEWGGAPEWTAHPPGIIYPDDPQLGAYRVQE